MMQADTLTRSGSTLHYWTAGPEGAPLIALAHGATLDHHSFDAQVQPLTAAGYRVLSWDLRGHGKSLPLGDGISIGILAEDLAAILDQLGVKHLALLGHSFGGFVVQEFLRRYPDQVAAIAIIGATNMAHRSAWHHRLLYRVFPGILSRMSLDSFRQRTLAHLSESESVRAYAVQAMAGIGKTDFIAITMAGIAALWLDSGYGKDYLIPKPFLLTHGSLDRANGNVFSRLARTWAAKEPHCRYEVIPLAGHTAHMDQPQAFNQLLLEFLACHFPTTEQPRHTK